MNKENYNQPEKQVARREALGHAIKMLTADRGSACCVRQDYVRAVREQVVARGGRDASVAMMLDTKTLNSWEALHKSHIATKRPEDLTVCYLCGPQPENDFDILVQLGVLPQNIWAFESDKQEYDKAILAVRKSRFPYLKVHKGPIDQFLIYTPKKFDVVYFDACAALPSRDQGTLRTLATLFRHHRLASPGVLATNFSTPDLKNEALAEHHAFLITSSLYPKAWLENCRPNPDNENLYHLTEQGLDFDLDEREEFDPGFLQMVKADLHGYYGQYVTRQIFDLALTVVPWIRLAQSKGYYFEEFFLSPRHEAFERGLRQFRGEEEMPPIKESGDDGEDFVVPAQEEPNTHPFIWTLLAMEGRFGSLPRDFSRFRDSWRQHLTGLPTMEAGIVREAIERFELLREHTALHGERLSRVLKGFDEYGRMPNFCDLPSRYLAFDSVVNQLAYPMHYVTDGVRRWRYQARETMMYLDVIPFDECRYLYEWLPTIDLLAGGMDDLPQQLCYRFALDGLGKQLYYCHYHSSFAGTAVIPF